MLTPNRIKELILSNPEVCDVSIEIQEDKWIINCVADSEMVDRMEKRQIQVWGRAWGNAYESGRKIIKKKPNFDFSGYHSSFNGEEFTYEEMIDWFRSTKENLLSIHPKSGRLLELGSGMGMVIHEMRDHCRKIVASDVSQYAIKKLEATSEKNKWDNVEILKGDAKSILGKINCKFDTIVLNTVIQYFPSLIYLDDVLTKAKQRLNADGAIYIGDIRQQDLLRNFKLAVRYANLSDSADVSTLKKQVDNDINNEKEMLYHPIWFHRWAKKNSGIYAITKLRSGEKSPVEMKNYRYDAILRFFKKPLSSFKYITINNVNDYSELKNILLLGHSAFLIKSIRNGRIADLLQLENKYFHLNTSKDKREPIIPADLAKLAENFGYAVNILCNVEGLSDSFSCAFLKKNEESQWPSFLADLSKKMADVKMEKPMLYPKYLAAHSKIKNIVYQQLKEVLPNGSFRLQIS